MIVSLEWLKQYIDLPSNTAELADRLALAGLNHEMFDDKVIDLEVTSNRPDCLGHIGVAREIGVLYDRPFRAPEPRTPNPAKGTSSFKGVEIRCPELCSVYSAAILRGVKIAPSPQWLQDRLQAVGVAVINNVVDVTNFVLMECGQPLHAFDFAKLKGGRIIVREAKPGEKFLAINHQEYELAPGTCVIADAERAVCLAGVMGGADSEVTDATTDILLEAAVFDPLSTRTTARRHSLQSPSSYRFERGVDEKGFIWASQRASQLILEIAGGEYVDELIELGRPPHAPKIIKLRFDQIPRILGIKVPNEIVQRILAALGCVETHICDTCVKLMAPSWRADLTREIDLIEEVARIHGYDKIPEDVGVKMAASTRSREDRVLERVRGVMIAAGFDEAMTLSAVDETWVDAIQPWTDEPPLRTSTPVLRRANCLRQTLLPSLLTARRYNEKVANPTAELFEIANVYLPEAGKLPKQKRLLAIVSGGDFTELKGVVESLVARLAPSRHVEVGQSAYPLLDDVRQCRLRLGDHTLGVLGELSPAGKQRFETRWATTVAELDIDLLVGAAELVATTRPLSQYPPVGRDLNIVIPESVHWSEVAALVRESGGELVESVAYQETYRNVERLGAGNKSLMFSLQLRSATATLTNEEADGVRDRVVATLSERLGAALRA